MQHRGASIVQLDDPRLTISTHNTGVVEIEVEDATASQTVLRLKISADLFVRCLGNFAWAKCEEATVYGPERLGKKHQNTTFEFSLGIKKESRSFLYGNEKEHARAVVKEHCPEGWQPDLGFESQDSFFDHNGERWARCTIRRWVPLDAPDPEPFVSVVAPPPKKTRRRKK